MITDIIYSSPVVSVYIFHAKMNTKFVTLNLVLSVSPRLKLKKEMDTVNLKCKIN